MQSSPLTDTCVRLLRVCAWCDTLQGVGLEGLPLMVDRITHTICPTCSSLYFDSTDQTTARMLMGHSFRAVLRRLKGVEPSH
jgi:hypothetical protein